MRKWIRRIGLAAGLVVVTAGTLFFLRLKDSINENNFEKIQIGMTEKEVETILGGPGTFMHPLGAPVERNADFGLGGLGIPHSVWMGRGTAIHIVCLDGRVIEKQLIYFDPPNLWEQFLEFLGFPPETRRSPF